MDCPYKAHTFVLDVIHCDDDFIGDKADWGVIRKYTYGMVGLQGVIKSIVGILYVLHFECL